MPTTPHRALRLVLVTTTAATVLALTGCTWGSGSTASPAPTDDIPPSILEIMDQPSYADAKWGLSVVDAASGEIVMQQHEDELFYTGSTAKILTVTAALAALGADHTFETPVYAIGDVTEGVLSGDLVLQGVGDLTLGGRTKADGTIDVPNFDHFDADVLPGVATLTPENPVAGLDALAGQVAAAGITRVAGDVLVDDRLWEPLTIDDVPISPITVNDNLVDFLITPGAAEGDPATWTWRPLTAAYSPTVDVTTGAADSSIDLTTEDDGEGGLTVTGSVPLGAEPVVWTYQVEDPATWARTLFIESLVRAGVAVDADPRATNDTAALRESLDQSDQVAVFTSPPFSETARLINKVSHNLGANQLPLIIAAQQGSRSHDDGLAIVLETLTAAGLPEDAVTYTDGQGLPGDTISPAGMTGYLRHLTGEDWFSTFYDSTPILGVDGSLASVLPDGDPAIGHAHAKTGTLVDGSPDELILQTKALAGYVDTAGGRRLAFMIVVNDVPIDGIDAVFQANRDLGAIASQLYQLY